MVSGRSPLYPHTERKAKGDLSSEISGLIVSILSALLFTIEKMTIVRGLLNKSAVQLQKAPVFSSIFLSGEVGQDSNPNFFI